MVTLPDPPGDPCQWEVRVQDWRQHRLGDPEPEHATDGVTYWTREEAEAAAKALRDKHRGEAGYLVGVAVSARASKYGGFDKVAPPLSRTGGRPRDARIKSDQQPDMLP